jgi:hypothetical protein
LTNEGDATLVEILKDIAQRGGWTHTMVLWNTLGTVAGAVLGCAALVIALVALLS